MTVANTAVDVTYSPDGSTTEFALPFVFVDIDHVKVELGGVEVLSGYSVSGAGDEDGGTLTFESPPSAGTATLYAYRDTPLTQEISPTNNATIFASVLARGLDLGVLRDQELLNNLIALRADLDEAIAEAGDSLGLAGKVNLLGDNLTGYEALLRAGLGLNSDVFDVQYASLSLALTAAAGKRLFITQAHTVSAAVVVPANTQIIGAGGSITATVGTINAVQLESGAKALGLRVIGPGLTTAPPSTDQGSGIHALQETNVEASRCIVTGFNNTGILFRDCFNVVIDKNLLHSNAYPVSGGNDSADIALYSSTQGGRAAITNNFCLSNNSQGILVNPLGHDDEITITGNLIAATVAGGADTDLADLKRRHGIILGYNQAAGGGRVNCSGNVIRNTASTGIYSAATPALARAVSIIGNTISKVGLITAIQGSLTGGITVTGGGLGMIVANNSVLDFRGTGSTGAINITTSIAGAGGTVEGNSIDLSNTNGIILQDASRGWVVRGNSIRNSVERDIYEATAANGGHTIEDNDIVRANSNFASIYIAFGSGSAETVIQRNKLTGTGKANGTADSHAGVFLENNTNRRVIVRNNRITDFYAGVRPANTIATRLYDGLVIDNNLIRNNHFGLTCYDFTQTGVVPVCGNIFEGNDTDLAGAGGFNVAYIAQRRAGKILLLDQTAAPAVGTWVAGDRAEYLAPAAGGVPGAVCTTAGAPGTWKAMAALAA